MKEENKKEARKNVVTGVSTAAGAVMGTVLEDMVEPMFADAHEMEEPEIVGASPMEEASATDAFLSGESIIAEVTENEPTLSSDAITVEVEAANPDHGSHANETVNAHVAASETESPVDESPIVEVQAPNADGENLEVINVGEPGDDIDGLIVSVDSEQEVESDPYDAGMGDPTDIDPLDIDGPDDATDDFSDTRVNGIDSDYVTYDSSSMPDYVNDANIDSYMDLS